MGLYDPDSPIRIKVLSTVSNSFLNADFLGAKIDAALQIRRPLLDNGITAYRLFAGENDSLPSLICDVYGAVIVIKVYSKIWLPYLDLIKSTLVEKLQGSHVVLRLARSITKEATAYSDGMVIHGEAFDGEVQFEENGAKFLCNVIKGHKTGFFLDQRHNRSEVQKIANNKSVLDVFSYAGGFGTHALVGGAHTVTCMDISAQALELAARNFGKNTFVGRYELLCEDAFHGLAKLIRTKKKYDLIIIDPPTLATTEKQIKVALNKYASLAKLGAHLLSKNGVILLASCSSRISADEFFQTVEPVLQSYGNLEVIKRTAHDLDHPVTYKEGAYLKCGYYRIN